MYFMTTDPVYTASEGACIAFHYSIFVDLMKLAVFHLPMLLITGLFYRL